MTYEKTMSLGQAEYQDVIDLLVFQGLSTEFIQTGGMNDALLVVLEGGRSLLVTDSDDSLSWDRRTKHGWAVGLFPNAGASGERITDLDTDDGSIEALLKLISTAIFGSQAG